MPGRRRAVVFSILRCGRLAAKFLGHFGDAFAERAANGLLVLVQVAPAIASGDVAGFVGRPAAPAKDREHATWIGDVYLTRWKCEEAYRFTKQAYQLEDVRVRSYVALRNMYALVMAALYFVSVVIGAKAKLCLIFKRVCEKAKRFYEIATFYQYAVADGIHRLLFASTGGPSPPPPPADPGQLVLAFAKPPS